MYVVAMIMICSDFINGEDVYISHRYGYSVVSTRVR